MLFQNILGLSSIGKIDSIDSICSAVGVDDWQIRRVMLEWGDVIKGGQVVLRLEVLRT